MNPQLSAIVKEQEAIIDQFKALFEQQEAHIEDLQSELVEACKTIRQLTDEIKNTRNASLPEKRVN